MRVNASLGVAVLDRGLGCPFATKACGQCYYIKFVRVYHHTLKAYHTRREQAWQAGPEVFGAALTSHNTRVRISKGGEPIRCMTDVDRLYQLCNLHPHTLFWVPTRSHHNAQLMRALAPRNRPDNLRMLASTDVDTTRAQWARLDRSGWSTMYHGGPENVVPPTYAYKCPKTWYHKLGHCATCSEGCFNPCQTTVWLKFHR